MERKVVVAFGPHAIPGVGQLAPDAGVVAALFDVAFEGLGVGAGTKAPSRTRYDDDANRWVRLGLLDAPAVLGVHAASPGIQAVGPVECDDRDRAFNHVQGGLQFHAGIVDGTVDGRPIR